MIGHWLTNMDQYECVFNDLAIIDWLIDSDGWVSFYWTGRECLRWSQLEISLLSYSWSDMIYFIKNLNTAMRYWDILLLRFLFCLSNWINCAYIFISFIFWDYEVNSKSRLSNLKFGRQCWTAWGSLVVRCCCAREANRTKLFIDWWS